VVSFVFAVVVGVGVGVLSMTPPEFLIAQVCFGFAAVIVLAKTAHWLSNPKVHRVEQMILSFLIFGVVGMLLTWSLSWVRSRQQIGSASVSEPPRAELPKEVSEPAITSTTEAHAYTLNPPQRLSILELLRKSPKGTVSIASLAGDVYAYGFAKELEGVLRTAHWQVFASGQAIVVPPVYGVLFQVHDEVAPSVITLKEAFKEANIPIVVRIDKNLGSDQPVHLFVGREP